jgi:hypothetical protein
VASFQAARSQAVVGGKARSNSWRWNAKASRARCMSTPAAYSVPAMAPADVPAMRVTRSTAARSRSCTASSAAMRYVIFAPPP